MCCPWGTPFMMFGGTLLSMLVLVAAGLGILWFVRRSRSTSSNAALEVLRERYARGDITREEFEARRKDLGA